MASKIFLDANIILDFLLKRADYQEARKLFALIVDKEIDGYITPAIVHIVGYWVTKSYGKQKAKELLLMLLDDITVIDSNHEITVLALHSSIDDIEDALQYYTALHFKLNYFITRDKKLRQSGIAQLPVYTMQEFLELI